MRGGGRTPETPLGEGPDVPEPAMALLLGVDIVACNNKFPTNIKVSLLLRKRRPSSQRVQGM
jgi:hypothetical protein